jgi:hypothetical protein
MGVQLTKAGSTITKSLPLGNTGVTLTTYFVTGVHFSYSQGNFISGQIDIAGYLDASRPEALMRDSIVTLSGPAANQDIMAWAVAVLLADAKYAGGVAS